MIGFDINRERIAELRAGRDRTREVEPADLPQPSLRYENDAAKLAAADFFIVTVPTPIDQARRPDLSALIDASKTVGGALKPGGIVVYEFDSLSRLRRGGLRRRCWNRLPGCSAGQDFSVGYSPERINPGDKTHRFETITKVVAGQDARTLDIVADVYGSVVTAGVHRAPSIKVAEAAKVIENTQRDLNIAFMNELSAICHQLGIDTGDVLAAAGTKWNFQKFYPGLVGGHCIGVDPYYLTYRAEKAGYHPEVILAGRRINDNVGQRVAQACVRSLFKRHRTDATVTILGLTFKENVPDTRNSKVADIIEELKLSGVAVQVHDPLAAGDQARHEYGVTLMPLRIAATRRCRHSCRRARRLCSRRLVARFEFAERQSWDRARRQGGARSGQAACRNRTLAAVMMRAMPIVILACALAVRILAAAILPDQSALLLDIPVYREAGAQLAASGRMESSLFHAALSGADCRHGCRRGPARRRHRIVDAERMARLCAVAGIVFRPHDCDARRPRRGLLSAAGILRGGRRLRDVVHCVGSGRVSVLVPKQFRPRRDCCRTCDHDTPGFRSRRHFAGRLLCARHPPESAAATARQLVIYAAICCALMTPWWLHNYSVHGAFVRLTLGFGTVLYAGNNPSATGGGNVGEDYDTAAFGHIADPVERDRALRDAALRFIVNNPVRFVELAAVKFARMWRPWPRHEGYAGVLPVAMALAGFVPVAGLSLIYLAFWGHRDWPNIAPIVFLIFYFTAVHMVIYGTIRYRLPLEPFLIMFASAAAVRLVRLRSARTGIAQS